MGIKGLIKLLADNAPKAMKERNFQSYFGRKIAIDASMSMYQFLIVVGRSGTEMLTNEAGEVTSHLLGMFTRTIRLLEAGMAPVYVFDGKPPHLKQQELAKRFSKRADASEDLSEAMESGNKEDIEKFSKRTVKVTGKQNEGCKRLLSLMGMPVIESGNKEDIEKFSKQTVKVTGKQNEGCKRLLSPMGMPVIEAPSEDEAQCAALCKFGKSGNKEDIEKFSKRTVKVTGKHKEGCKRLLSLMGMPVIEAPSEAEAQCAALCKSGKVYAVASEDMDSLTFGAPRFLRHLMGPSSKKVPVMEFEVAKILEELNLTMDQFIDLCILSGCDYCGSIRGIGGKTALKLIHQHGSIENILENINNERYQIPDDWPYQEVRQLFKEPVVLTEEKQLDLMWTAPDEEGLITFLVNENGFNSERVTKAIERIKAAKNKSSQGQLESF